MHDPVHRPRPPELDRARRLAALAELGLHPRSQPETTEIVSLPDRRIRLTQAVAAMGTLVAVTVLDRSADRALELIAGCLRAMDAQIAVFNRFESSSALSLLNERGRLSAPPPELARVLAHARALYSASGGAFDVTVQPLVDLFRRRRAAGLTGPPPESMLAAALARVDGGSLHVGPQGDVELRGEGIGVTLDGIAKGFIVDAMASALEAAGCTHYLVNAGGDIRARGGRDGTSPWRVAVRDPNASAPLPGASPGPTPAADPPVVVAADAAARAPAPWLEIVACGGGALATSGSYEIFCGPERTYHHLICAATGGSAGDCVSVTVRAPTCTQADALATAVFVMGAEAGVRWLERRGGAEALVVAADGTRRTSRNWNRHRPPPAPQRGRAT